MATDVNFPNIKPSSRSTRAISCFKRECGATTCRLPDIIPLRMIVKKSPIASTDILRPLPYQLVFFTPGSTPLSASSLKQRRHSSNMRINPRGLPQRLHLFLFLTANFGVRRAFSINALRAIMLILY